jgi:hypothetical protein
VAHTGWQAPPEQLVDPWAFVQAWPHAPQCAVVDRMLVSQPSFGSPLQLPKPALHDGLQAPLTQLVLPLSFEQALSQAPQSVVVLRLRSQPLPALLSQLPKPVLQAMEQVPPVQDAVPLVLEQALPHAPQWATVFVVLVSHPLLAVLSQLPKPALQVPRVHVPVEQDSAAFARSQTRPQPAQFESVDRLVSQPLPLMLSQLP